MAYQEASPRESFLKSNLPKELFGPEGVEAYGNFNFLKTGIYFSDIITTVSEKYASEICLSDEIGAGLSGLLSVRQKNLHGILNGIDHHTWGPFADNYLYRKFDSKSIEAKSDNKSALVSKLGLDSSKNFPLLGSISRMVSLKGFDLLAAIMEDILKLDVNFVMLASGDKELEKKFEQIQKKFPNRFSLILGYDDELAHID